MHFDIYEINPIGDRRDKQKKINISFKLSLVTHIGLKNIVQFNVYKDNPSRYVTGELNKPTHEPLFGLSLDNLIGPKNILPFDMYKSAFLGYRRVNQSNHQAPFLSLSLTTSLARKTSCIFTGAKVTSRG